MIGIVDRIEGGFLKLEIDNEFIDLPITLFPEDIKEGDLVRKVGDEFIILREETEARTKRIQDLFDSLFEE